MYSHILFSVENSPEEKQFERVHIMIRNGIALYGFFIQDAYARFSRYKNLSSYVKNENLIN